MSQLEDRILQYIISGQVSEGKDIEKEIANDPSFDQADFDLLQKIWNEADQLREFQKAPKDHAWQNIMEQTGQRETIVRKIPFWRHWSAAASIAILLIFGIYMFYTQEKYDTIIADQVNQQVTLPDGSVAILQEGTQLRLLKPEFFIEDSIRGVYMLGGGRFDIQSDSSRPFFVFSDATKIEVLGTSFIYEIIGDISRTENLSGVVEFSTLDGSLKQRLNEGDKATYTLGDTAISVEIYVEPEPEAPKVYRNFLPGGEDFFSIIQEWSRQKINSTAGSIAIGPIPGELHLSVDSLIANWRADSTVRLEAVNKGNGYYEIRSIMSTAYIDSLPNLYYDNGIRGEIIEPPTVQ